MKEPIKIQNHKGKGKYSMKMTKRRVTMRYSRYISRRTDKIKFKTKNRKKLFKKKIKNLSEEENEEFDDEDIDNLDNIDNIKNEEQEEEEIEEENEIEEKEEEEEEEEEEEKRNKNKNKNKFKNNIIIHLTKVFYNETLNKMIETRQSLNQIKGALERGYREHLKYLKNINNEYYFLFEITFYCIYLNLLEINLTLENDKDEEISFVRKSIMKFIKAYEKYSLYINFIDEEGAKTFIKNKYDELYAYAPRYIKLYPNEYKSNYELRQYLLNKKKFKLVNNTSINIVSKKVNFISEEKIKKIYPPPKNEIELESLHIPTDKDKSFYKGDKANEVKNFYETFNYDSSNKVQREKFSEKLIESYLSIVEK